MVKRIAAEALLKILGKDSLNVYLNYHLRGQSIANKVANDLIVNRSKLYEKKVSGKIVDSHYGLNIVRGKGPIESDLVSSRKPIDGKHIEIKVSDSLLEGPRIVVDVRYYHLHKLHERISLIEQLRVLTNLLREYLTERHVIIASVTEDFQKDFMKGPYDFRGGIHKETFNEILPRDETVVLDPYGEEELTLETMFEYKYFVIGGIVDRGNRFNGYTKKMAGNFKTIRISLEGDIKGVPDRINRIAEILVYLYCGVARSVKEAIKLAQAPIIARKRLPTEIKKRAVRFEALGRRWLALSLSDYEELKDFMNFRDVDIEKVLDRDLIIITDELFEKILKSKSFDSYGRTIYVPNVSEEEFKANIIKHVGKKRVEYYG